MDGGRQFVPDSEKEKQRAIKVSGRSVGSKTSMSFFVAHGGWCLACVGARGDEGGIMFISRNGLRGGTLVVATVAVTVLGLTGGRAVATPTSPSAPSSCGATRDEFGGCVTVTATLDRAPAVGSTATLSVRVDPRRAVTAAALRIDLPANLTWQRPPAASTVSRHSSTMLPATGDAETATSVLSARAHQPVVVTGTVRALTVGDTLVSVRLTGVAGHPDQDATASLPLTIGVTPHASYLGYRPGPSAALPLPAGTRVVPATPDLTYKPVRPTGLATPTPSHPAHPDVFACATGSWTYQDQTGTSRPQVNIQVQLWATGFLGDDLLAVGLTDADGSYRLCSGDAGGRTIYVREVTENGKWQVQNASGGDYTVTSPTASVGNGATHDFGSLFPANAQFNRPLHAYDEANDASTWTPGDCWSPNDTNCKVLHIRWTPTSTDGTFYTPNDDTVHLVAADPDIRSNVVHELGHGVMDNAYHDNFPTTEPACQHHTIEGSYGPVCAWTEGFADWFQAAIYNDPVYDFGGGSVTNLETPTWGTPGWSNGDTVEGRIAGALIDLTDTANEPYWDRHSEANPGPIMQTLFNHRSTTFAEFWTARGQDHVDVGPDALAALYQNTIDYQFRDPLADYTPLTRPAPIDPNGHNYQFTTTTIFWSVVALRPAPGDDEDLYLYSDAAQTNELTASALGAGAVDFIAVDSNRRALGTYYPKVRAVTGGKEYQIELAQGANLLGASEQIPMGATDVVTVRDDCVAANTKINLTATPSDAGQNGALFLMADNDNPAVSVQPRGLSVAQSADHPAGQPATLTYTTPAAGCYGVVLINQAGAGTYTLTSS
jgi:hypothetical protein